MAAYIAHGGSYRGKRLYRHSRLCIKLRRERPVKPLRNERGLIRCLSVSAIVVSLALHAVTKGRANLQEMLWVCHVASLIIAIGIFFHAPRLTASGFLFHVALGLPGYLMDVIATGATTPTSMVVHLVPPIAGGMELWRRGFPNGVVLPCAMLYPILVAISYVATDPALNVNLAYAPWPPVAKILPQPWMWCFFNIVVSFFCLTIVEKILRRLFQSAELKAIPGENIHV